MKEHVGGGDSPYITLYYHSFDGEQGMYRVLALHYLHQRAQLHIGQSRQQGAQPEMLEEEGVLG